MPHQVVLCTRTYSYSNHSSSDRPKQIPSLHSKPHSANSSLESLNQLIEAPVKCALFDSCSVCNEWFCPQNLSKELSRNLFLAQCYAITKKIHIHIQHIYASRHTSICYQKDIDVLEQVQRKTVKLMKGIEDRFGEEKLKELRLFALQVKKG